MFFFLLFLQPIESFINDARKNNQHHTPSFSFHSCFENTTKCPPSPYYQHRQNFTHINNVIYPSTLPTITKNMLVYQQQPTDIDNTTNTTTTTNNENEQEEKVNCSIFITSSQLSAYMTSINRNVLIIDCGSPLRHNERRIKESCLLNINDKLSRKRLITRGLKNFLDQNQLDRLNQSEFIILYNDSIHPTTCSNTKLQNQISPIMQCIFDEIKRYDSTKIITILQSSFEEFYQHYPNLCYTSSNHLNHHDNPLPSPTVDIDLYQMSEILPGLYLGNANDAKDLNLLQNNHIKLIINISTNIPCYYKEENLFEYCHLSCYDTCQQNILQYFENIFKLIEQKLLLNENILVHCQGGISRSPSFIIGYLMKYHSKTFDQAYEFVKDKRKIINPNLSFLAQLTRYEHMITTNMQ